MNREEQAAREIGHTEISVSCARFLLVFFLLTLVTVPAIEFGSWVLDGFSTPASKKFPMLRSFKLPLDGIRAFRARPGNLWEKLTVGNRKMLEDIASINDDLTKFSTTGDLLRPPVQEVLFSMGWGNERVLKGQDDWLFFRTAVDYLNQGAFLDFDVQQRRVQATDSWKEAPAPDPLPAIIDFSTQLKSRGITLILLPVPVKAGVVPEKLCKRVHPEEILHNPSWEEFRARLTEAGISLYDVTRAEIGRGEAFLHSDSHWKWDAMDRVAEGLAEKLKKSGIKTSGHFSQSEARVSARGDLFRMLPLLSQDRIPEEALVIRPVTGKHGTASSVFLLGDSFSNIYSDPTLHWGAHAGLGERLSFHLQTPVETIIRNDGGAVATRMELAHRLAANPGFLNGARYLIWEFTERELSFGDWRLIDLGSTSGPRDTGVDTFIRLDPGEKIHITGIIKAMGEPPDPAEAAYPDYIIALHIAGIESGDPSRGTDALVFLPAMKDYEILKGGTHRIGQHISLTIQPWTDVSDDFGSIARGEIFDRDLLSREPCWGVEDDR